MKLNRKIRWSKATAILAVSMALVVGLGAAVAFAVLAPPTNVVANDTTVGNQVSVAWSPTAGATSYVVQYKLASAGDAAYTTATVTASTVATVTDATGLLNGSAYVFRVKGVGLADESPYATSNQVIPSDKTAPIASLQVIPAAPNAAGWYSVIPTYTITANDPSGISSYQVTLDNSATVNTIANGGPVGGGMTGAAVEGTQTIKYRAIDGAGNTGAWVSQVFNVDLTNPTVPKTSLPVNADGLAGWFTTIPTITLDPADAGSGVGVTSYHWNALASVDSTSDPVVFKAIQGSNLLTWSTMDLAGRTSTVATEVIKVDSVKPSTVTTPTLVVGANGKISIAWAPATDTLPGSDISTYTVEWSTETSFGVLTGTQDVTAGVTAWEFTGTNATTYYVRVKAFDAAGNASAAFSPMASATADTAGPTVTIIGADASYTATSSIPATITAIDGGSGLFNIKYRWYPASGVATGTFSAPSNATTTPVSAPQGDYILQAVGVDVAGNVTTVTAAFKSDWSKPVSTFTIAPATPNGLNGWYTSIDSTITAADVPAVAGSGVTTITLNGVQHAGASYALPAEEYIQGTKNFVFFASDLAGNVESANATVTIKFDSVVPTITAAGVNGYVSDTATAAVPAFKFAAGDLTSGVDHIEYVFVAHGSTPGTTTVWTSVAGSEATATAPEGHFDLYYRSVDVAGLKSANAFVSTWSDTTIPTTTYTTNPAAADGANGSWKTAPLVTFVVSDTTTEGATTYSRWDATGTVAAGATTQTPSAKGTHTLEYYTIDAVGNREATKTATFVVNQSQPIIDSLSLSGATNLAGWYSVVTTASVTATTNGGLPIGNIFFKYDAASTWTTYTPVLAANEGSHTLSFYATDASGTVGPTRSISYKLDLTDPVINQFTPQVVYSANPTLTVSVTEAGSGLASGTFLNAWGTIINGTVSGSDLSVKLDTPLVVGDNMILVTAKDVAGRSAVSKYLIVTYVTDYTISSSAGANGVIAPVGSNTVAVGADETFTVTPNDGYHVADVKVDGVSVGAVSSYTFHNVMADHTISATFAINTFTVTATAGTGGSISPAGAQTVNSGANVSFTITPASGFHIADVTVGGVSKGAVSNLTVSNVTANTTVAATFAADVPTSFTITGSAGAHGSLSISGATSVAAGSNLTVAITPEVGYHIASVTVDGVAKALGDYTFTNVSANHTISATFAIDTFAITASAGSHGTITGPASAGWGTSAAFTIAPATGYHVADVKVDGVSVGAVTSYTFTNVKADHTISATFEINTFTITATAGANGTVTGDAHLNYGSDTTFTITPAAGYHVVDVLVDDVSVGAVTAYKFSNVTANHTISATFAVTAVQTSLTITSDRTTSYGGRSIVFSGKVYPASMLTGSRITVWLRAAGGTWGKLGTVYTSSTDKWTYTLKTGTRSHGTYYVRVKWAGNSSFLPSYSPYRKVYIR